MTELTVNLFSDIAKKPIIPQPAYANPWNTLKGNEVSMSPIKKQQLLGLWFMVKDFRRDLGHDEALRSKHYNVLTFLLGHEAKGSLLFIGEGW